MIGCSAKFVYTHCTLFLSAKHLCHSSGLQLPKQLGRLERLRFHIEDFLVVLACTGDILRWEIGFYLFKSIA